MANTWVFEAKLGDFKKRVVWEIRGQGDGGRVAGSAASRCGEREGRDGGRPGGGREGGRGNLAILVLGLPNPDSGACNPDSGTGNSDCDCLADLDSRLRILILLCLPVLILDSNPDSGILILDGPRAGTDMRLAHLEKDCRKLLEK